ncbi:hypothetical protein BS329_15655 [Amycolatopsis coloradensis]|uniref:L,D-TPase catalytic domain-containing protein n=1 Tax=Amycolatopsis coloradensis TaxID=76021 RepID=A0A1R0KUD2_9PSEU|nr:hypothetical protein BS329_15655 [Amycolatopsis coloradensis]
MGRGRVAVLLVAFGVLAVVTLIVLAMAFSAPDPASPSGPVDGVSASKQAVEHDVIVAAIAVSDEDLAALPQQSTFADLPAAPRDPAPDQPPSGLVLHPRATVPLYAAPGGAPIAALPPTQLGSDTWVPVVDERPGWAMVLLPGRPNGAAAWLYRDDPRLDEARTPYLLRLDRATYRLELVHNGAATRAWTVGIGKPAAPTPAGRAFLLASIRDTKPTFSPIVLPLSAHSDTFTTYGGGPGTVGIHTWPTAEVYGKSSSDGCIRVPADALQIISSEVPLGTPVLVR